MSVPVFLPSLYPSQVVLLPHEATNDDFVWENFEFIQNNWLYFGIGGAITIGSTGAPASTLGTDGDFYFRKDGTAGSSNRIYHREAGSWVAVA